MSMPTNRELKALLDSLSEEELDMPMTVYSGSVETLVNFSIRIMDIVEHKEMCDKHGSVSRLFISTEH